MSSPVSTNSVAEAQPSRSFWSRWWGVYLSPGSAFADISRRPDFLWPLIAAVVSTLAVTETMLAKIGMARVVRLAIEQSSQGGRMSAEQMDQAVEQGARVGAIFAHLGGLLGTPIFLLIVAALGLGILNGIFGAQLNFKAAFSVTCYASLTTILSALMALAVILFGDPEHFNPNNPAPSNLGFFLNPFETSKPLLALASSIDLFTLWFLALLGIGFSRAAGRKVKSLSIFLIYFALWMIWVLGKVGFAMLM